MLHEALIDLIQEKRWDKIRVQDVLDRTGIGRSTFYAHFDNKYALLTGAMPDALTVLNSEGEPDLLPLFEHVEEVQPVLRPILSQPLLGELSETFQRQLVTSWREYLTTTSIDSSKIDGVADFLAGGFMAVMHRWLAARCDRPAEVVWAEHQRYVDAVLAEVTPGGSATTRAATR